MACCLSANEACHFCNPFFRRNFHSRSIKLRFGEYAGSYVNPNTTPRSCFTWASHSLRTTACW